MIEISLKYQQSKLVGQQLKNSIERERAKRDKRQKRQDEQGELGLSLK